MTFERISIDPKVTGRSGCLPRALAGTACFIPAFLAAAWVGSQAPEADPFELFFNGTLPVFAVWLGLPMAVVLTWRAPMPWRAGITSVVVVGALAFTLWTMRPVAPDGSEYDIDIADGENLIEHEVTGALDTALPGRWERLYDERWDCTDIFARDRGAARSLVAFEIRGGISLADQAALESSFEDLDWVVTYEPVTFVGGPGRRFQAEREGFTVATWGTFLNKNAEQPGDLDARTPCLRQE